MTEKKNIVLFYIGIGVFAVLLIIGFIILGDARRVKAEANNHKRVEVVADLQMQSVEDSIGQIKYKDVQGDLTALNHFGETVSLQSLKGKVWVFAQFYGTCPECNSTNLKVLQELFEKYGDNPNFHIVTISVKPDENKQVLMQKLADFYSGNAKNWWFLSADVQQVNTFCQEELGYMAFRKNENYGKAVEGGADAGMEVLHDMRVSVYGADMGQWAMVDIAAGMKAQDDLRIAKDKKKLDLTIQWALDQMDK